MNIVITEEQLKFIKDKKAYIENNNVEIFNKETRKFIYCLLKNDKNSISDYLAVNGIKKGDFFRILLKYGVIKKTENNEILVPKKNFDKKIDRIFYELFSDDEPGLIITEDGEAGTSCGSVGGDYEAPVFGIQRRKITNITNEQ